MTVVINIKDAPEGWQTNPEYVYIGRTGKGLESIWGNPFIVKDDSFREKIVNHYRWWLLEAAPKKYLDQMDQELYGKILVCFCKPKLCHGDVIVEYVDRNG